jgi:hypothetical protein
MKTFFDWFKYIKEELRFFFSFFLYNFLSAPVKKKKEEEQ